MAFQPISLPPSSPQYSSELRLDRIDGGVSYKYIESQLNDNQSPYMINLNADDRGALTKRFGQKVFKTMPSTPVHQMAYYKSKYVIAHNTKLSTYNSSTDTLTEILTGLSNAKGSFFIFNDILYYINGTDYVQWNGTTASTVESNAYVPTLFTATPPAGGGTALEQFNLLTPKFKTLFSGDAASTAYQLPLTGLDAALLVVTVDGVTKTETTHFTVNRTTGVVTFTSAPSDSTPNNVSIQAEKTVSGAKDKIKNCKYVALYGGSNDTRVFITGNSNFKNYYFRSGLYDASYWPENDNNKLGSDSESMTGFVVQYDSLLVFKEKSIWSVNYTFDGSTVSFPAKPVNSTIGCDMPWTIQLIENSPVFCNTYAGVHILLSSDIRDERNVKPLSGNINGAKFRPGLLDESKANLLLATSVDFDQKYYICVGSKVWTWDYELSPYAGNEEILSWFHYTNINANCWLIVDRTLYLGDRTSGVVAETTPEEYNDFESAIEGIWKSKLFAFKDGNGTQLIDYLKTIQEIWFNTRSGVGSSLTVTYYNDNGDVINTDTITASTTNSFAWSTFDWSTFTWATTRFAPTLRRKPKIKKVVWFQIEFKNNEVSQNLSILNLIIKYVVNRKVK